MNADKIKLNLKDENGGEVRRTAVVQNMEYFEFGIVVRDDPGVTLQNK